MENIYSGTWEKDKKNINKQVYWEEKVDQRARRSQSVLNVKCCSFSGKYVVLRFGLHVVNSVFPI